MSTSRKRKHPKKPAATTSKKPRKEKEKERNPDSAAALTLKPEDLTKTFKNEYFRYSNISELIQCALIERNADGTETAMQFALPYTPEETMPPICKLVNFKKVYEFGDYRYRAYSADDNTEMNGTKGHHLKVKDKDGNIKEYYLCYFTDAKNKDGKAFWGDKSDDYALFNHDLPKGELQDFIREKCEIELVTFGGKKIIIDPTTVAEKYKKKRSTNQNKEMGNSAHRVVKDFFEAYKDVLTEKFQKVLDKDLNVLIRRMEWNHTVSEGLKTKDLNYLIRKGLQTKFFSKEEKYNLTAAPKWVNTRTMMIEHLIRLLALLFPNHYQLKIKPLVRKLLDTDIMEHLSYKAKIINENYIITVMDEINPHQLWPVFNESTDAGFLNGIVFALSQGQAPISTDEIEIKAKEPAPTANPTPTVQASSSTHTSTKLIPNESAYQNSVVQLLVASHEYSYNRAWLSPETVNCSGTGTVIRDENGELVILTNAHVVENALQIIVRLPDGEHRFEATTKLDGVKRVSHQCDLAIVRVKDPLFQKIAKPVEIGEMVKRGEDVLVVGHPTGGSALSFTQGIASRSEDRPYVQFRNDDFTLMATQVDAPINPGNSGGACFNKEGKLIGVPFQKDPRADNIGYIIPVPIINHFLKETFSGKNYRGFPILTIESRQLNNPNLREYYGLSKDQTGILITKVHPNTDAAKYLQKDDILLSIDGLPISNKGTANIPGIGSCCMDVITQAKFVGDSVDVEVLRKNPATRQHERHKFSIVLDHVPSETTKVPAYEHDKMADYFAKAGIVLMPVTPNYLNECGGELSEYINIETNCSLTDVPKEHPDDQIIVVSDVLTDRATQGYKIHTNAIVKEINGKKINNMQDAIEAMENNEGNMHHILTHEGLAVLPNMSPEENATIFKRFRIPHDRSEGLRKLLQKQNAQNDKGKEKVSDEDMDIDEKNVSSDAETKVPSQKEEGSKKKKLASTFFDNLADRIQRHHVDFEFSDAEEEDDSYQSEDIDEDDEEEEEINETPSKKLYPIFTKEKLPHRNRLFQPRQSDRLNSKKHHHEEIEKEAENTYKKPRIVSGLRKRKAAAIEEHQEDTPRVRKTR